MSSKDLSKLSLDLFLLALSVVEEFLEFLQGANGAHFSLTQTKAWGWIALLLPLLFSLESSHFYFLLHSCILFLHLVTFRLGARHVFSCLYLLPRRIRVNYVPEVSGIHATSRLRPSRIENHLNRVDPEASHHGETGQWKNRSELIWADNPVTILCREGWSTPRIVLCRIRLKNKATFQEILDNGSATPTLPVCSVVIFN